MATGILSEGEIAPPIRGVLHRQRNVEVELAEVSGFHLEARTATMMRIDGGTLDIGYDSLIVAAGAGQSYFGHDEFSRWAPGMKTINDALELRGRILGAFEMAELEPDPERRRAWLTFVVVGGGPTGVEIAGQIAELSRRVLRGRLPRDRPEQRPGPPLRRGQADPGGLRRPPLREGGRGSRAAGSRDPHLSIVSGIDRTGVRVKAGDEERRIERETKVWAAGVQASPLARMLAEASGAECDRAGRIQVLPDCTLPGHPRCSRSAT